MLLFLDDSLYWRIVTVSITVKKSLIYNLAAELELEAANDVAQMELAILVGLRVFCLCQEEMFRQDMQLEDTEQELGLMKLSKTWHECKRRSRDGFKDCWGLKISGAWIPSSSHHFNLLAPDQLNDMWVGLT